MRIAAFADSFVNFYADFLYSPYNTRKTFNLNLTFQNRKEFWLLIYRCEHTQKRCIAVSPSSADHVHRYIQSGSEL